MDVYSLIATLLTGLGVSVSVWAVIRFLSGRALKKLSVEHELLQQTQSQQVIVSTPIAETQHILSNPPIPRTPEYGFVARYDDQGHDLVNSVSQLLKQDRVVALLGSGGVGKTTLAAEIARKMQAEGMCVVWASADGRADFSLTTLLDEAATQLGNAEFRTLALEQKTNAVRNLLAESRAMIVLDNFETIAIEQQKAIATFVNTLSGPALITSRLAVEGADRVGVGAMSPEETRDFLTRLIANSPKRNALTQLNAVNEIATIAERNPMVMRWTAGQLELAQRISDVLGELSRGQGDAATRVFGRSFGLLNADAQAALLCLALCVPSADRAALAFTAGFGDDINRLNDALKQLAGLQLLETNEKSERLSVVGLIRRFTSAQLDRDLNAAEYRKRFVDYFTRYAEAHAQTTPEDLDALEAEYENLFAAMDVAFATQDWQSVMQIADVITKPYSGLLGLRGYWDDAIARSEQGADAAQLAGDESAVARFLAYVATVLQQRGEYDKAKAVLLRSLQVFERVGEDTNVSVALHQLGIIALGQGDYETARRLYAQSLQVERKFGDQSGIARSLYYLGILAQEQGEYATAQGHYAQSLQIAQQLGDQYGTAITMHQLGIIAQQQGDYESARQRYAESLEIEKKLGNQSGIASTLLQLGNIAFSQGDYETARQRYSESLAIKKKLGDQSGIATTLSQMGLLAEDEGNKTEAARLFREALEIFERLKSPDAEIVRKSLERVEGGQRTTTD